MTYDPHKHNRRSIRLCGYDYAQAGAYFVTICTRDREHLFGRIVDGTMQLNRYGRIVRDALYHVPRHFRRARIDAKVVMPNHVHVLFELRQAPDYGSDAGDGDAADGVPCSRPRPRRGDGGSGTTGGGVLHRGDGGSGATGDGVSRRGDGGSSATGDGVSRRGEAFDGPGTVDPKAGSSGFSTVSSGTPNASPLHHHPNHPDRPDAPDQTDHRDHPRGTGHSNHAGHPTGTTPGSLGAIVQNVKSITTRKINRLRKTAGAKVWQRGYYDRIVRNASEHARIRRYIEENPRRWTEDMNHPTRL